MTSAHFYSWAKGLKTGVYYLRTRQKAGAQKFTVGGSSGVLLGFMLPHIGRILPARAHRRHRAALPGQDR